MGLLHTLLIHVDASRLRTPMGAPLLPLLKVLLLLIARKAQPRPPSCSRGRHRTVVDTGGAHAPQLPAQLQGGWQQ